MRARAGASLDDARAAARRLGAGRASVPVRLPLAQCDGAVLAAAVHARTDMPVATVSAMDGYAVNGVGPWSLVGTVLAGGLQPLPALGPGQAVEVATGALVPVGTDRVLPVEVVALRRVGGGRSVVLEGDSPTRRHVRPRGEESVEGDLLLPAGHRVGPAGVGLAAGAGHDDLLVRPPPRVAALVTGDELLTAGLPRPGRIRDALGPLLPAAVRSLGGELVRTHRCGDAPAEFERGMAELLGGDADVLLTCGMAGAGPADRLRPWLAGATATVLVDGVQVRPGHPQVLASLPDGRPLVGLPGNPLAGVAALLILLGPLLAGIAGRLPAAVPHAVLQGWEPESRPGATLLPVRWGPGGCVRPAGPSGSAQLRGLAVADAVAVVPGGWRPGEQVELLPVP